LVGKKVVWMALDSVEKMAERSVAAMVEMSAETTVVQTAGNWAVRMDAQKAEWKDARLAASSERAQAVLKAPQSVVLMAVLLAIR
jgi:hypothetical protein